MSATGLSSAFERFAAACDAARGTASKLVKTKVIAEYLRGLGKGEVGVAARYLAGQPFSASSGRSLGVGGALVVAAIREVAAVDRVALQQAFRAHGEIGEAVSAFWPAPVEGMALTLGDVQAAFEGMAGTGTQEGKRQALLGLLRRAGNREAVYLLKIILGDMRTGVSEGIVEAGIAEAFGVKVGEVRGARLLVGDLDVVAELAMEGRLGEAAFRPFVPLGYMLAQPVMTTGEIVEALAGRGAVAEDKYDGIRAQLHVAAEGAGVRVELFSRGSGAVTQSFPDIANAVAGFAKRTGRAFVLDGEIVPMRLGRNGDRVMLPFSMLQKRLGRKVLTAKQMVQNPVAFVAFDCLYAEGELLLERPLAERREKLRGVLEGMEAGVPVVVSGGVEVTTAEGLEGVFAAARVRRNEGLVIKRLDSLYTPGRRGDAWMKLKSHLPTLDVVVVGAELGHGKRRGVLSDVTFAVRAAEGSGELLTVGKAYTGLTDVEIAGLTERFMGETVEVRGRFRVVRPTVVLEIAFDQLTKSERHTSGYAMRFPRIVRIREDKTVEGIDTLERVRQIYVSPDNLALGHEGEKVAESLAAPDQLTLF